MVDEGGSGESFRLVVTLLPDPIDVAAWWGLVVGRCWVSHR